MEYKKQANDLAKIARQVFERDGFHVPMIILYGAKDVVAILDLSKVIHEHPDDWKDAVTMTLTQFVKKEPAIQALAFISEAWVYKSKNPKDHVVKQIMDGEIAISELKPEDRQEVISIAMSGRDGTGYSVIIPIIRKGKKVTLGEADESNGVMAGRFGRDIWKG